IKGSAHRVPPSASTKGLPVFVAMTVLLCLLRSQGGRANPIPQFHTECSYGRLASVTFVTFARRHRPPKSSPGFALTSGRHVAHDRHARSRRSRIAPCRGKAPPRRSHQSYPFAASDEE